MRNRGYGTTSISEIVDAISVLISYGLISKPNSGGNNSGMLSGNLKFSNSIGFFFNLTLF